MSNSPLKHLAVKFDRRDELQLNYTSSFPKEERMPFILMLGMSCLWNTEFLSFYEGNVICGIIYMATMGKQTFIMFFAVDEKIRAKGYGSRILSKVQELHTHNKLIVSIEPCDKGLGDAFVLLG